MTINNQLEIILKLKNDEEYTIITNDCYIDNVSNLKELYSNEYCEDCNDIKEFRTNIKNDSTLYKWLDYFIQNKDVTRREKDLYGNVILSCNCGSCNKNYMKLYSFFNDTITKVFQATNQLKNNNFKYNTYKEISTTFNYFNELSKARYLYEECNASIGAYVYIRRCLEAFVNTRVTEEQKNIKFEEKINSLKNIDNKIIKLLKPCCDFLSKSIHELEDTECKEKLEKVFDIMELLLDDELLKIKKSN